MSRIVFSSGVTANFLPRAPRMWDSIRQHGIPFHLFLVDFTPFDDRFRDISTQTIRYADVKCPVPKTQMQHGAFTQFWQGSDDDVCCYVDSDAYFQRPLKPEETAFLSSVGPNEFMAGRNNPDPYQTLENEAMLIGPNVPRAEIDLVWPGYDRMLCRNFGFLVARVATWKRIYAGVIKLWPAAHRCFWNPAVVQFVSLYSGYSQGMVCRDLDPVVHNHGHLGLVPGSELIDGAWHWNGKKTLFAHAL